MQKPGLLIILCNRALNNNAGRKLFFNTFHESRIFKIGTEMTRNIVNQFG